MNPTRTLPMLVLAALALLPCGSAAAVARSNPPAAPAAEPAPTATPDFDGDGLIDIAVTYLGPWEDDRIRVYYGSGTTASISAQRTILDESGYLGQALLARDFDADGRTDLAFTGRGLESGTSMCILFGSATGLPLSSLSCSKVPGVSGDLAPSAMALVETPTPRLVVGLTDRRGKQSGRLVTYTLGSDGRPIGSPSTVRPGSGKVAKLTDAGSFGEALASSGAQLFVGAPRAKVATTTGAGVVAVLTYSATGVASSTLVSQRTAGVPGSVAKGDGFGSGLAARDGHLVVGTPGDQVGTVKEAGSVQVFTLAGGRLTPTRLISQASPGVPGTAERRDRFGAAVAVGTVCSEVTGVVVGAPGEDILHPDDSEGAAWVIPLEPTADCPVQNLYEGHGLTGKPEPQWGRFLGESVGVARQAGESTDRILIGGSGLMSDQSPIGVLAVWSAETRTGVSSIEECVFAIAGR